MTNPGGGVAPGRVVTFVVGEADVDMIRRRGGNAQSVKAGDELAAIIVRVWDAAIGSVNLRVLCDAPDDYWATSVVYAQDDQALENRAAGAATVLPQRTWHWPDRV